MARFFKKREEIKGLSPGSLVFIGNKKVENVRIRVIDYDGTQLKEDELKDIGQGADQKTKSKNPGIGYRLSGIRFAGLRGRKLCFYR